MFSMVLFLLGFSFLLSSHHIFRLGNPTSGLLMICMLPLGTRNRSQVFGINSVVQFESMVLCKQGLHFLFVSWPISFHRWSYGSLLWWLFDPLVNKSYKIQMHFSFTCSILLKQPKVQKSSLFATSEMDTVFLHNPFSSLPQFRYSEDLLKSYGYLINLHHYSLSTDGYLRIRLLIVISSHSHSLSQTHHFAY